MIQLFGSRPEYQFSHTPKCKWCDTDVYYTERWDTFLRAWIYVPESLHYNQEMARRKYRDIVESNSEYSS